jgi:hypothetical protein
VASPWDSSRIQLKAATAAASCLRSPRATGTISTRSSGTNARSSGSRLRVRRSRVHSMPRRNSQPPSRQAGDHHAVGAAAQGVFDEGGRQHAGADQAHRRRVRRRRAVTSALWSQPNTTRRVRPSSAANLRFELAAQQVDRQLRHVDAGDQAFLAAEGRRGRAGAGADAATGAKVGIDDGDLVRPLVGMRRHGDGFIGAVGVAAAATVAVRAIDHGDRFRLRMGQEGQGEEQDRGAEDQRPYRRRRGEVGQRMEEEEEPVDAQVQRHQAEVGRRVRQRRLPERQQQEAPKVASMTRREGR